MSAAAALDARCLRFCSAGAGGGLREIRGEGWLKGRDGGLQPPSCPRPRASRWRREPPLAPLREGRRTGRFAETAGLGPAARLRGSDLRPVPHGAGTAGTCSAQPEPRLPFLPSPSHLVKNRDYSDLLLRFLFQILLEFPGGNL